MWFPFLRIDILDSTIKLVINTCVSNAFNYVTFFHLHDDSHVIVSPNAMCSVIGPL